MEHQQSDSSFPLQPEIDTVTTMATTTTSDGNAITTATVASTTATTNAGSNNIEEPPIVRVRWIDAVWNAIGRLIAQKGINEFSRQELIRGYLLDILAQSWSTTGTPTRATIVAMNDLLALGRIVKCRGMKGKYMVSPCHLITS